MLGNIWNGIVNLFVPEEGYFENEFNTLKQAFELKLSYQSYIDLFEQTKDVVANEQVSIAMNGLQVGGLNISMPKFISFDLIERAKPYYFPWIRGITFIILIISAINTIYHFVRGSNLSDVSNTFGNMDNMVAGNRLPAGKGK